MPGLANASPPPSTSVFSEFSQVPDEEEARKSVLKRSQTILRPCGDWAAQKQDAEDLHAIKP